MQNITLNQMKEANARHAKLLCWAGCGIAWNRKGGGAATTSASWNGCISSARAVRQAKSRGVGRRLMGLVLTLKPQERIILGGAVVRNNGTIPRSC